jgi:flagellar basal body-associated protein FliL
MSEEKEAGSLKTILIGLASTIALGVGGYVTKQLTGEEEAAQPTAVSAPAPVINITTNNTQQQKQVATTGGTRVVERVVEKPAAPKKKTEKEELKETPQW